MVLDTIGILKKLLNARNMKESYFNESEFQSEELIQFKMNALRPLRAYLKKVYECIYL